MKAYPTAELVWHDLQWCVRRTPRVVLEAMKKHGDKIFVAGGFIRSCIAQELINDIDLFVSSKDFGAALALELAGGEQKKVHESDNAFTIRGHGTTIQIIHRWLFDRPETCIQSFDFTIACAAIWWEQEMVPADLEIGGPMTDVGRWCSICDGRFYADLAGKRLIYRQPIRNEDAGGSLLRVLKFYQRGYRIPLDSMSEVIARLMSGVKGMDKWDEVDGGMDQYRLAKVLCGLLREVDPNIDPTHIAHLPSEEDDEPVEVAP